MKYCGLTPAYVAQLSLVEAVVPAQAGTQSVQVFLRYGGLDSGLRRNDDSLDSTFLVLPSL